jgi:hypothetical protein
MVVVYNERATPLSPEDGEVIARLAATRDGASPAIAAGRVLSHAGLRAFPDPHAVLGHSPPVRLVHPEGGTLRA